MKTYLSKNTCADFNLAANKEWLETNILGGYACSTIYGLNNRRYHGLFVVPSGTDDQKVIILSKFEESIFIKSQIFEISTNQFSGGIYPEGYKYLVNFSIDPFPKFVFEIENKRIEKTLFLLHDQNTLVIRYAYKNQGPPLNLVLKPMIAARGLNELSHEITNINTDSYLDDGVVKLAPKATIPELRIHYQKGEYIPAPLWYHNYLYEKDSRRKQDFSDGQTEDLLNPGFFTCFIEPYETLDLYVTIETPTDFDYESVYRKEKNYRQSYDSGIIQLPTVAKEISKRIEILTYQEKIQPLHVVDYPLNEQSTGEMLFSLWGLAIFESNEKAIQDSLLIYTKNLNKGVLPNNIRNKEAGENRDPCFADLSLIFINLIYYLYNFRIDLEFVDDNLFEPCRDIIDSYTKGTFAFIMEDEDGLLLSGTTEMPSCWISQKSGNDDKIRFGKLCEINALWYSSLKIMEYFSRELDKKKLAKQYASKAEITKTSFLSKFWSKKNLRYYDLIRDDYKDFTFSINQLFIIALPFSMLDVERGIFILKQIEEHLLTPLGLRSLSPNEKRYEGRGKSKLKRKDQAYYTGSIWPWPIGIYVDAVLRFRGTNQQTLNSLNNCFEMLGKFFYEQGLGNISEFFEGNPPHRRSGQICSGLNLTELLRSYFSVDQALKARDKKS
jgi:predicted glycogen debranching enzyme